MKVYFVGAGPGDPELLTLKGRRLLAAADIVVWAGSLVNPALLDWAPPAAPRYDSAGMSLAEVLEVYEEAREREGSIVRLHSGDPSLYGAIQEQLDYCAARGIPTEVVPGVSSVFAAAASFKRELTLPGVSQSLVVTRVAGRTGLPPGEELAALAAHGTSLALFLSGGLLTEAARKLSAVLPPATPVRLVRRASWPDERIAACRLGELEELAAGGAWEGQTMVLVGRALEPEGYEASKLYDSSFSHGRRKAT